MSNAETSQKNYLSNYSSKEIEQEIGKSFQELYLEAAYLFIFFMWVFLGK